MTAEIFDVVDDDDHVLGKASRRECHEKGLIHRCVMFIIYDEKGRILVNRRSQNKEFFPGYWSVALGGHVHSGETYMDAAVREIQEEAGLQERPFPMGSFRKRISQEKENVRVYGVVAQRRPTLDSQEVAEGSFIGLEEIGGLLSKRPFLPETQELLGILREWDGGRKL